MESLFKIRKGIFDHALVDSPPVQAVADALINNLPAPGRGYGGYYPYQGDGSYGYGYGYGDEPKGEEASAAAKVALRG